MKIKTHVNAYAEGSCLIEVGRTQVLCLASIEEEQPRFKRDTQEGWVTAEYEMLPRATHTRGEREAKKGRQSGRTQEISRLIGRALRSVCDFEKLGPRTITLDCEVLQADGGTRCASITGAYIALSLAVRKLLQEKRIKENPLSDSVAALSVGIVNGQAIADLNYIEDSSAEVDMNIIMTGKGKLVEIQGTAEKDPFSEEQLMKMLALGKRGIRELTKFQRKSL